MRTVALVLSLTLGAAPICGFADTDDGKIVTTVVQHEKATLAAFKTHDKKSYERLCLPSFYEITSAGTVHTLAGEIRELDDFVLGDYRMEDVVVTVVSDSTALIRYKITAQWIQSGRPLPIETMLASAVWIRSGKDWKAATYEEVKMPTGSAN